MRKLTFFLVLTIISTQLKGQTFNGTGGIIPDDGTIGNYYITVSGLSTNIDTLSFGLETVCINLTHTWDDDLTIQLISPDSTIVTLTSHAGGDGDDYANTCFEQNAVTPIMQGSPPFTGTFKPLGQMGLVNNNQDPNGVWTLRITDTYPFADIGTLFNWSITFGNSPASYYTISQSTIPIVIINTGGSVIVDEPKTTANMRIINNAGGINLLTDSANEYDGFIGIEVRGASSQFFPKKSFKLETRDSSGNNFNRSILGMPSDNDWVLIANYHDKSLLRNYMSYNMFYDMGHYATRMKFCNLIVNNEYQGIYLFGESIKRGNGRVDIAKLDSIDNFGDELTGGYIFKRDGGGNAGWNSAFPSVNPSGSTGLYWQYVYPDQDHITPQQGNYIEAYVDSFEQALDSPNFMDPVFGYRSFIDVPSFIDEMLLWEFTKNIDGYRKSTYYHKDKWSNGGKIVAGPTWDYDLSWGGALFIDGQYPTDFNYILQGQQTQDEMPFWHERLMQDSTYVNELKCRWQDLRTNILNQDSIFARIDSSAAIFAAEQAKNFTVWPIIGINVWVNPSPVPTSYAGEIQQLKDWTVARLAWLDSHMPGTCILTSAQQYYNDFNFELLPNPAHDFAVMKYNLPSSENGEVIICDMAGKKVAQLQLQPTSHEQKINLQKFDAGIYLAHIRLGQNHSVMKFVKE